MPCFRTRILVANVLIMLHAGLSHATAAEFLERMEETGNALATLPGADGLGCGEEAAEVSIAVHDVAAEVCGKCYTTEEEGTVRHGKWVEDGME